MRPAEKKQYLRQNQYNLEHYDRYGFVLAKGYKEKIMRCAEKKGLSISGYIKQAIMAALKEDGEDV